MAGAIRITELDLSTGTTHISTDYQISDDKLFNNILAESIDDHDNLTTIVFNITLDPEIKYFARARVRLSTGYTAWGNVDLFTPDNINDIAIDLDLPSLVGVPQISLDSPITNHPLSLFNINVSGFSTISSSKHVATTYYIEDINGSLIWASEYNEYHRDTIFVDNMLLKKNTIYRIKAIFHTSSNDVSQVGSITIKTMNAEAIQLTKPLVTLDPSIDNYINIVRVPHMTGSTLNIYQSGANASAKVFENQSQDNPTTLFIPIGTLEANSNYFITITVDVLDTIYYDIFTTY